MWPDEADQPAENRVNTPYLQNSAKSLVSAERPNELETLTSEQRETFELVAHLTKKLVVVSNPEPTDDQSKSSEYPHIGSNVQSQRQINSDLRYILRTLVI